MSGKSKSSRKKSLQNKKIKRLKKMGAISDAIAHIYNQELKDSEDFREFSRRKAAAMKAKKIKKK